MKKVMEQFSGDFSVMRVCFSTENPLKTLDELRYKISYKTFEDYIEYLDAREAIEDDAKARQMRMMQQQREAQNGK